MSEPGRGLVLFSACVWTAWLPLLTVCAASLSTSKFVGSCASDSCVMTNEVHSYAVIDVKSRYGVSGIGSSDEATPFNRGDPAADRFHWACLGAVLAFVLACSGCATEAGLSTSDVESVAKGDSVTLLVLGTGNQWAPRTEPDLYMVVQAQHPTPAEKVQTDLSECQVGAREGLELRPHPDRPDKLAQSGSRLQSQCPGLKGDDGASGQDLRGLPFSKGIYGVCSRPKEVTKWAKSTG